MPNIKASAARSKAHVAHREASRNGNGACAPLDLLGHVHRGASIHIDDEIRAAILRREVCACAHTAANARRRISSARHQHQPELEHEHARLQQ